MSPVYVYGPCCPILNKMNEMNILLESHAHLTNFNKLKKIAKLNFFEFSNLRMFDLWR